MNKVIQEDIECITGKCYVGDITPLVYLLLKDTQYKDELLRYLGYKKIKPEKERSETPKKLTFDELFGNSPIVEERHDKT